MEMKNENLKTGATETINLSLARYKLCEHMKVHLQTKFSRNKTRLLPGLFYIKGCGAEL